MFGNTRLMAEAIAGGLARHMEVDLAEVGGVRYPATGVDLLVVGGPTHAFGMSRANTRKSAADMMVGPLVSGGIGMREWLEHLGSPAEPTAAAAFDTRINKPRVPGSAAAGAQKRLRKLGFSLPVGPETFFVDATIGPVLAGEYERAHRWGEELGAKIAERELVAV